MLDQCKVSENQIRGERGLWNSLSAVRVPNHWNDWNWKQKAKNSLVQAFRILSVKKCFISDSRESAIACTWLWWLLQCLWIYWAPFFVRYKDVLHAPKCGIISEALHQNNVKSHIFGLQLTACTVHRRKQVYLWLWWFSNMCFHSVDKSTPEKPKHQ